MYKIILSLEPYNFAKKKSRKLKKKKTQLASCHDLAVLTTVKVLFMRDRVISEQALGYIILSLVYVCITV